MKIRDILRSKGRDVVTASAGDAVLEAVRILMAHNIGGVVVMDDTEVTGILTERDILRLVATTPDRLHALTVGQVMTRAVITGRSGDDLAHVMEVMTENRIRHLPVVDADGLVGIVTIGDVVNAFLRVAQDENQHLKRYIQAGG